MSKTPEELIPALRQYLHNDGSDFVAGYDIAEVNRIFAALREENERLNKDRDQYSQIANYLACEVGDLKARVAELEEPAVQGEPVYLYRRLGINDFVTCDFTRYTELTEKPKLFETKILYTAPQPAEQKPELAKYQPCGCVICTCEHETQCQGCGGHHCGTHPVGQFTAPAYLRPAPDVSGLVETLKQVIRCRQFELLPDSVQRGVSATLDAHRKGGES